jgi:hypothetical protein
MAPPETDRHQENDLMIWRPFPGHQDLHAGILTTRPPDLLSPDEIASAIEPYNMKIVGPLLPID